MEQNLTIASLTHPEYDESILDWFKWRLTYCGGRPFIHHYLERLSTRESWPDFEIRKLVTYCPAFAAAALDEVKNAIFQRMVDVTRAGGSPSYQDAIVGTKNGVDLRGSSMASFIGCKVLPELLSMRKVGIFVDNPKIPGPTQMDQLGLRPYLYVYQVEDIRSWSCDDPTQPNEFTRLLLCDHNYSYDQFTNLPTGQTTRYRYFERVGKQVLMRMYNEESKTNEPESETILDIPYIPFIMLELPHSLLKNTADYQICMLNLASSDVAYTMKSNFPFYVEQVDPRTTHGYGKPAGSQDPDAGTTPATDVSKQMEIKTGVTQGRAYAKDLDQPAFIHPSSEPLIASMKKQDQLKQEIRLLTHLAVANLDPVMASADSKGMDNQGLESGLSAIGMVLETGERKIALYWDMYERLDTVATVNYPQNYSIRSEADRQEAATVLQEIMKKIPSDKAKRAICKEAVRLTMGMKVTNEELAEIYSEIDSADSVTSDFMEISQDWLNGFVSTATASLLRGYKDGEAELAKTDRAERIAETLKAQGGVGGSARGNPDGQVGQPTSGDEKGGKPQRGAAPK